MSSIGPLRNVRATIAFASLASCWRSKSVWSLHKKRGRIRYASLIYIASLLGGFRSERACKLINQRTKDVPRVISTLVNSGEFRRNPAPALDELFQYIPVWSKNWICFESGTIRDRGP